MSPSDFTIVTTLDLSRRAGQLLERLAAFAAMVKAHGHRLVIGHEDRGLGADAHARAALSHAGPSCCLVGVKSKRNEGISNAALRNAALEQVDTRIVLMLDLDIHTDARVFEGLAHAVTTQRPIAMLPTLYLNEAGSRCLAQGLPSARLVDDFFSFERRYVMHLAAPSSVMAFYTADARAVGGFDERYVGHGYEDFDFMLRLALHCQLIDATTDLQVDQTYAAPLLATGFRARLATLCLDALIDRRFAFHLFHAKQQHEPYYVQRERNRQQFRESVGYLLKQAPHEPKGASPPLVEPFFSQCHLRQVDPLNYAAYFDARPGHLVGGSRMQRLIHKVIRGFHAQ